MNIKEYINKNEYHSNEIDHIVVEQNSSFQNIKIVEFKNYGKSLILNDRIQSTEKDEFIYHESLVFPAFTFFPKIKKVLSIGGANGGIERELLKITSLKNIKFIDVDEVATKLAKIYLPHMFGINDMKKKIQYLYSPNPLTVIEKEKEKIWDLIINDFPDAIDNSYCTSLYTLDYFKLIQSKLTKKGIAVFHLGSLNDLKSNFFLKNYTLLKSVFNDCKPYTVYVPSFGCSWILILCSNNLKSKNKFSFNNFFSNTNDLKFYDEISHKHLFNLPKYLRIIMY
jgi:spermidine synthase